MLWFLSEAFRFFIVVYREALQPEQSQPHNIRARIGVIKLLRLLKSQAILLVQSDRYGFISHLEHARKMMSKKLIEYITQSNQVRLRMEAIAIHH